MKLLGSRNHSNFQFHRNQEAILGQLFCNTSDETLRCDNVSLKTMTNDMWGTGQCLGKKWPFIGASPYGPRSLASVEANDTSATVQKNPFIHTGILYLPSQFRWALYVQWKCSNKRSPEVSDSSIPNTVCGQLSPALSHSTFHLPLIPPTPPPHPSTQHPSSLPLSVRWRLQKRTITGLTPITKDTSQLLQALNNS